MMIRHIIKHSSKQPRRRAFTLVEMLVVIGIIVLVLGLSVPTMRTMSKGSTQQQGRNMVSSVLASARATAVNMHTTVTAVFYEDGTGSNRSSAILLYQNSNNTYDSVVSSVDQSLLVPFHLPMGMKIGSLAGTGNLVTDASQTSMVSFNEQGQVVNKRIPVAAYVAGTTYGAGQLVVSGSAIYQSQQANNQGKAVTNTTYWIQLNIPLDTSVTPNIFSGYSAPGILIYDATDLAKAGGKTMTDPERSTWLTQNGTLMVLNAYTGNTIR